MTAPAATPQDPAQFRAGLAYAFFCYLIWGVSPLYWALYVSPPFEIVAHRAIWAAAALAPFAILRNPSFLRLFTWRRMSWAAIGGVLILANWVAFIWAVTNGFVLEASLGYFIGPLINVALGLIFLGERLRKAQWVAVGLAFIGVTIPVVASGQIPVIGLFLAVSFSLYAFVRKRLDVDGATGLFLEVLLLSPFALIAVIWLQASGAGHFFTWSAEPVLLIFAGAAFTAGVLLLFGLGARRLPLSTLGLIQYLAPSIQFGIGIWQGEAFPAARAAAFAFIWTGLAIYTWDLIVTERAARRKRRLEASSPVG